MSQVSRRSFLAATAGVATTAGLAGAGFGGTPAAAARRATAPRATGVPVTSVEVRVVVIGSGFGGGVSALRLAQAGVPVLLLERGKRWPTGPDAETFPHAVSIDKRANWMGSSINLLGIKIPITDPYVGLVESVVGDNMTANCAAGYGGGSLVYQGMTLKPAAAVFNANLPQELDYAKMSSVYYPRVASMLQIQTAPDELINSSTYKPARIFASRATAAGQVVEKIPMPIDWSFALRELKGEMKPSYTNGDCALGVNNGGKHSVDVTYLAAAEATGKVTVATQHNVTDVEMAADGRWIVRADRIAEDGTVLEKKVITAKALVMAAGSCNTTKLLVRAAGTGKIPNLPDALGGNWGTNADQICTWTSLPDDFTAPQGGPVVYGTKDWASPTAANTIIQASLPPLPDLRTTVIVGYGVSSGRGKFVFDSSTGQAKLTWPTSGDSAIATVIRARMSKITGPLAIIADSNSTPTTWHPMGGASMGSVCDLSGRVLGHSGLYVLDGALLPGNAAACNPSMTIAAVAERALEDIVAHDVGTVI
jgi:cholesterol oxidase